MRHGLSVPGRRRIAIIGGGFSGAAILLALLRESEAVDAVVYEPEAELGPGLAYGAAAPWHLLNVVATRASLLAEDADHWWRWAQAYGPQLGWPETAITAKPDAYLPRGLYGRYVATLLDEARRHHGSSRILHHRNPVTAIHRDGSLFSVIDNNGQQSRYDAVVLATGAPAASYFDFPALETARTSGRWIDDPWNLQALEQIGPDQPVLIVGSALTMADTVLSLCQQGHRGPIHVLSRHGIVPAARHEQVSRPTGLSVDDSAMPISWLLQRLRRAVKIHGAENWQGIFEGLRGCTNDLWACLPSESQRRFMRHLKAHWDAHRFRMPPSTADVLNDLEKSGRLHLHKGRLLTLQVEADSLLAAYRPRGSDHRVSLAIGAIVDCTGPRRPMEDWAGDLLDRLKADGLIATAPCGIGIHATTRGAVLDAEGRETPGLFLLGPPLRGILLESTAISDIRNQAVVLAGQLTQMEANLVRVSHA